MSKKAWTALVTTGMALSAWAGDSTYTTTDKSTKHTTRIYVTNYVQVPVRCGQLESADVVFQPGLQRIDQPGLEVEQQLLREGKDVDIGDEPTLG